MCGFLGVFGNSKFNKIIEDSKVLSHRGKDDEGVVKNDDGALKFFRLSINDLSENGNQPFKINNQYIAINGEIYNHEDLRLSLEKQNVYVEKGSSDCKIASLNLVKNNISDLEGMFAGVIWDTEKKTISLFRDHLGIKPLYYLVDNQSNYLIYASEIKAILEIFKDKISNNELVSYILFNGLDTEETLYENIKSVKPGEKIKFWIEKSGEIKSCQTNFFDSNYKILKDPIEVIIPTVEDALIHAVDLHTKMDVNYAFQLSGGLDSSLLCALEKKIFSRNIYTFSISLPDAGKYNEFENQQKVSSYLNSNHVDIPFTKKDFIEDIEHLSYINDFPLIHPNSVPIYKLAKIARENFKVLISGEGADELFMGYPKYTYAIHEKTLNLFGKLLFLNNIIPRVGKFKSLFFLLNNQKSALKAFLSTRREKQNIFNNQFNYDFRKIEKSFDLGKTIQNDDMFFSLYWLLSRYDRFTMCANVEGRVPYCDKKLFDICRSIPTKYNLKRGYKKFILKNIALKYLPIEIVLQNKIGFSLPLEKWFTDSSFFISYMNYLLKSDFLSELNIELNNEIRNCNAELIIKKDINLAWKIFSIAIWLRNK
ncbi:Asparagine synthetase (glutamine-hydrolyzing) [Prochlorococcus marinus str. MIT 9321]|uniref:asparagine synthase (glutamine-hydrolyzing) n=1 Tax=Prochlorococcus marinus str. MIT 9401 TaxID=167551 RepID=A0A0A2BCN0_PROMR|nr:asparagine synthase (glutamine-hydrolyzing) [Prochlorococcus marinus]KGG02848.1 Asparagine synthetase (glutamine-hydrolyzing) [Prochlorococcus marinus str. MIT 9321]KGG05471.1 Asparagine synthetase (glutamine-hydrolyzing) [Prochlorococcus marinus str. MIT 9322]KGG10505.1 Asparagine synthetase (glutamine-hydrolyzing) [Prochlorococcus marinus str. MIT 9401]